MVYLLITQLVRKMVTDIWKNGCWLLSIVWISNRNVERRYAGCLIVILKLITCLGICRRSEFLFSNYFLPYLLFIRFY